MVGLCTYGALSLLVTWVGASDYHEHPQPQQYGQPTPPPPHYHEPPPVQEYMEYPHDPYQPEVNDAKSFYEDLNAYVPYEEYQAAGYPDYWYTDEDKVVRPSVTRKLGYIPREIMHFRETFKYLRTRYPDLPLLSPEDFGRPEYPEQDGRKGRFAIFGSFMSALFGGGLGGLGGGALGGLGGGAKVGGAGGAGAGAGGLAGGLDGLYSGGIADKSSGPFGDIKNKVATGIADFIDSYSTKTVNSVGVSEEELLNTPMVEYTDGPGFNAHYGNDTLAGVAVCRNGEGVCENCETCIQNGGVSVGQCNKYSSFSCCCQYVFDSDSNTDATISYFTSPGFPTSVRDSFSYSLTVEVRDDVDQLLVEFVSFELAAGPRGCRDNDFVEIIAPTYAGGILGPSNSKFCGLNTDQHLYLNVNPGDIVIFKVVVSGVGFVPFEEEPHPHSKKNWNYRTGETRFKMKITQILKELSFEGQMMKYFGAEMDKGYYKESEIGNYYKNKLGAGAKNSFKGFYGVIPDYYLKLRNPTHCLQYYSDTRGTFQNFNFDGKTCMPPNLDYTICLDHPRKFCGVSLSALTFDIPTRDPVCMDGAACTSGLFPCCTAGFIDNYGKGHPDQVTKFLGIDGTSDGRVKGTSYMYDQPRYFFCGESMGKTNFVVSQRRGPAIVKVYSDWHDCTQCKGYKRHGVGFKIKYNIDMGTC